MNRFRRVAQVWSWLPAFRSVAEQESINRAAEVMATSPSALSRTVKLLEDALGQRLFERARSGMRVTPAGARLLVATRNAMRLLDDCITEEEGGAVIVTAGASSPFALAILGAVIAPSMSAREALCDEGALVRGEVDLLISEAPASSAQVISAPLGALSIGVWGKRVRARAIDELAGEVLVGVSTARVAAVAMPALAALRMASEGRALAVLPDLLASSFADDLGLRRACEAGPAALVHAHWRRPASDRDPMTARVRELARACSRRSNEA